MKFYGDLSNAFRAGTTIIPGVMKNPDMKDCLFLNLYKFYKILNLLW
jgi:hypothetical protein